MHTSRDAVAERKKERKKERKRQSGMRSDDDSSSENYTEWAEGQPRYLKGYNFAPITGAKRIAGGRMDGW